MCEQTRNGESLVLNRQKCVSDIVEREIWLRPCLMLAEFCERQKVAARAKKGCR